MTREPQMMTNRIKELRMLRKLSLEKLANKIGADRSQVWKLEMGHTALSQAWMERIAKGLECHPAELLIGGYPPSIEARTGDILVRGAAEADAWRDERWEPEYNWRPWPAGPDNRFEKGVRFGVELADDHADRRWPAGSILVCAPADALDRPLHPGEKVVVDVFAGDRHEIRVGAIDATSSGAIVLLPLSNNRHHQMIVIRDAPTQPQSLSDAGFRYDAEKGAIEIDPTPLPGDRAEIVGVVTSVFANEL